MQDVRAAAFRILKNYGDLTSTLDINGADVDELMTIIVGHGNCATSSISADCQGPSIYHAVLDSYDYQTTIRKFIEKVIDSGKKEKNVMVKPSASNDYICRNCSEY